VLFSREQGNTALRSSDALAIRHHDPVSNDAAPPDSIPVTRAELEAHLANGVHLDLRARDDAGRTVAGALLRAVIIEEGLPRNPRGLTILGALIPDGLDLSYCTVCALRLPLADFKGVLELTRATITGELNLTGARLNGKDDTGDALSAEGLQVDGDVFLDQLKVAAGAIRLTGATISGRLILTGAEVNGENEDGNALAAGGLQVGGGAYLDQLRVAEGAIGLTGATITGELVLTGAQLNGRDDLANAIVADRLRVGGDALLDQLKVAGGAVRMLGATIAGKLSLTGSELYGKDDHGDALVADRVRVDGGAFLGKLKVTMGAVRLSGATITGQLTLTEATLAGSDSDGRALIAERLHVNGSVYMRRMKVSAGAVRLLGATITGQLTLTEAALDGSDSDGRALIAERLRVNGSVYMRRMKVSAGAVRMLGTTITGQLVLTGAELNGSDSDGRALVADRLHVNGSVFLGRMKVSVGAVRMLGTAITGDLVLTGAELSGRDGDGLALFAARAQVDGSVFLRELKVATGGIRLSGASIIGDLVLTGAELGGKDDLGCALDADRLQVNGETQLDQLKVTGGGRLSLQYGQLGNLVVDEHLPRNGWHRHNLLGLRYDQVRGGPARSARQGARLLASQADEPRAAQPYWQLADYYARVGNDSAARRLRVWSNVLQSRAHIRSWPRFLYGVTTGFGYYPFLTLLWLAVFIGIDTAAVHAHSNDFIPTKAPGISVPLTKSQEPVNSSLCDSRYPCFDPILYATDTVVPVISLGQQDAWRIDSSRAGVGIQMTLLFTSAGGWILTTLLIGGVGGLLRRN
jgi:hypothetical protein